jgi:hypothetical protein
MYILYRCNAHSVIRGLPLMPKAKQARQQESLKTKPRNNPLRPLQHCLTRCCCRVAARDLYFGLFMSTTPASAARSHMSASRASAGSSCSCSSHRPDAPPDSPLLLPCAASQGRGEAHDQPATCSSAACSSGASPNSSSSSVKNALPSRPLPCVQRRSAAALPWRVPAGVVG